MDALHQFIIKMLCCATVQDVEKRHLVPRYRSFTTNAVYHEKATEALSNSIFGAAVTASHTQYETGSMDRLTFSFGYKSMQVSASHIVDVDLGVYFDKCSMFINAVSFERGASEALF